MQMAIRSGRLGSTRRNGESRCTVPFPIFVRDVDVTNTITPITRRWIIVLGDKRPEPSSMPYSGTKRGVDESFRNNIFGKLRLQLYEVKTVALTLWDDANRNDYILIMAGKGVSRGKWWFEYPNHTFRNYSLLPTREDFRILRRRTVLYSFLLFYFRKSLIFRQKLLDYHDIRDILSFTFEQIHDLRQLYGCETVRTSIIIITASTAFIVCTSFSRWDL